VVIEFPTVPPKAAAAVVAAFLAGAACPAYYAQERFRGFGRAMLDRLPYRPPPGMEETQALREAAKSAEESGENSTE